MHSIELFERKYVRPRPGRTLIVGSKIYGERPDRRALYKDAIGIDMEDGEGVDVVADLEYPPSAALGWFDHVECFSVLEHSKRPWQLAANLNRLMVHGATIHVTVPFIWRVHAYPSDYWRFTANGLRELFPHVEWKKICYAHVRLTQKTNIPTVGGGHGEAYFLRTEVCGFGAKK